MITPAAILDAVSIHYDVEILDLRGPNRVHTVALARAVGMYLTRTLTRMSYPQIGAFYGKDHCTVIHAVRRVTRWLEEDVEVAQGVRDLMADIRAEAPVRRLAWLRAMRAELARELESVDMALAQMSPPKRKKAA